MKKFIALILLISTPVFGDTNVTHLLPGNPAPYEGYLFTIPAEKELRLTDAKLNYEQDLNIYLTKINDEYRQTVDVMQTRIKDQGNEMEQLAKIKSPGFFGKEFYFVLGAVLSGLVSYGVYKSSK